MTQMVLSQVVVVEAEIDGIEMGVLADGTAYLTLRGLATVCGVAPSSIIEQVQAWNAGKRTSALAKHLIAAGFTEERTAPRSLADEVTPGVRSARLGVPDEIEDLDRALPHPRALEGLVDLDLLDPLRLAPVHVADGVEQGGKAGGVHAGHRTSAGPGSRSSADSN